MARTRQNSKKTPDTPGNPVSALWSLGPLAGPQFHQYWEMQERLFKEAEQFRKDWFERRQTAALTALQTTADVLGNTADPAAAAKALHDWQVQSAERIGADVQDWIDLFARSAQLMAKAEVAASRETMETVSNTLKDVGHQHATPV